MSRFLILIFDLCSLLSASVSDAGGSEPNDAKLYNRTLTVLKSLEWVDQHQLGLSSDAFRISSTRLWSSSAYLGSSDATSGVRPRKMVIERPTSATIMTSDITSRFGQYLLRSVDRPQVRTSLRGRHLKVGYLLGLQSDIESNIYCTSFREVVRIKNEHPDDSHCIVNDRVKGRLKVTRAFGAGFLKQPKLNDALLEMFRNEYIGTTPYLSCSPSLCHHKLRTRDQFLVLSSDGLYQYLSNQEVVSHVECFIEKLPEGDPAQHLIEELLLRAAKKAGMDLHELLDIPQGDRRKYHDDVTVMVISLEGGRIWKSSGKYL